ncbi:leucine zipper domain-containing protein [Nesterenkonia pannonica]|uniref:helix-turn-helix domain-containing protein n=1 Tax=Nesterenkonia pannonica TaxID=1548602 RepID=UPI0021647C37|nr:leucine zipper domain-containing protein [Nesterenkonia pannonica]
MSHGRARLTVCSRRLIVQRHQTGWKQAHIVAAIAVSRKCIKTLIDRYAAEGEAGRAARSSRPYTMPTRRAFAGHPSNQPTATSLKAGYS